MRSYVYLPLMVLMVLTLGMVAIHCSSDNGHECDTNDDCPTGFWCNRAVWKCECILECTNKCGGPDNCGGTCEDNCAAGTECNTTTWTCDIIDNCGNCTATQCCINNACADMACGTMECGDDPVCSMSCGTCTAPETCSNGACVGPCVDDGDCTATQCCVNGTCAEDACATMECGNDPVCNRSCGICTAPETCQNGQCVGAGDGQPGDPCAFGDVNATEGDCDTTITGIQCLGIAADGNVGTCPGGAATECTSLRENWNRDCVGGNCGASFCSEPCDAQGNCKPGFLDQDVGNPPVCMCVPTGGGQPGDPCPWNNVNASYDECAEGACLGNEDTGNCPGGTAAECSTAETWNPDCVSGVCGFSFCSPECEAGRVCPANFYDADVGTPPVCYCIPEEGGTSGPGEPCPFGDMNNSYDFCMSGLTCLGNDNTGSCPGGSATECGIPDIQNPDCVNGVCGFSHCSARCDAQGNCEAGFVPATVGTTCYCVPGEAGTAQAGDPCPFTGGVNDGAENCAPGLACLGFPADGQTGTCPGGDPAECTDIPASANPDCVGGNCGASFCAEECDQNGNCPAGFAPEQVGDPPTCYCVPS